MRAGTGHTPFGIGMAAGAAAMTAATTVAAVLFHRGDTSGRLLVVALVAGIYAAVATDTRAALATAGLGYLLFNGFLVHRFGELAWDGSTSTWHLTVIAIAAALGLGQRWIRRVQADLAGDDQAESPIWSIRPRTRAPLSKTPPDLDERRSDSSPKSSRSELPGGR